ncbi:hypothetical protein N599_22835 [Saccharopolyspora erythraea D]|nr:hypothetical protein N599_22835 [Saccharopolyspora erythraea D]
MTVAAVATRPPVTLCSGQAVALQQPIGFAMSL